MRALRVVSGVAAAVALTAVVAGCQATVSSAALDVGECFNHANSVDADGDQVESNVVTDCSQPHEEEVFSVFDYPGATAAFPGYEQIGLVEQGQCQSDFEDYVGITWEQSSYTISYAGPTESTWAGGDHAIHCLLADASGRKLTGSARGSER
jgi:hypothetical protein